MKLRSARGDEEEEKHVRTAGKLTETNNGENSSKADYVFIFILEISINVLELKLDFTLHPLKMI